MKDTKEQLLKMLQEIVAINPAVYSQLPPLLQEISRVQKRNVLMDVSLLTTITAFGALRSNVFTVHSKKLFHPNNMLLILAGFASGKSVMRDVRLLFAGIIRTLSENHAAEMREYRQAMREYRESGEEGEIPEKPIMQTKFIAADSSTAALIRDIYNNGGTGIILETEASVLSGILQTDFGDSKGLFLKIAMNEEIEFNRKQEVYTIADPHVSLAISTTPQKEVLQNIFADGSDGLTSRVMVYYYKIDPKWDNEVFNMIGWREKSALFNDLSQRVERIYDNLGNFTRVIHEWTPVQTVILNKFFQELLKDTKESHGDDSSGLIFRLGLTIARISTVFTMIRVFDTEFENLPLAGSYIAGEDLILNPTDEDLTSALMIISTLKEHVLALYGALQQGDNNMIDLTNKRVVEFYNHLPSEFARAEALTIGSKQMKSAIRTVDKYLHMLATKGLLTSDNKGNYSKTK